MNYSIRHCAFVISALIIGVIAIDLNTPAQARPTRQNRNYAGAWNLANSAIFRCYNQKNLNECSKLTQIKNTLESWCYQNDRDACITYKNVVAAEGLAMTVQTTEGISNIR
jgi:hypothetical protein